MITVKDKSVLIAGGARGLGAAQARMFAQDGAQVLITDIRKEEGEKVAHNIRADGGNARFRETDATVSESWAQDVADLVDATGRLDVVINDVGINDRYNIMDTDRSTWDEVFAANSTSVLLGIQAAVPIMRANGGGSIVNVGSTSSVTGTPFAAYSASKWAMRGLGKIAAREFAADGIRVNTLCPGLVVTEFNESQPYLSALEGSIPIGRASTADEVASMALYLASDASASVTGQDFVIDGGLTLGTYKITTNGAS